MRAEGLAVTVGLALVTVLCFFIFFQPARDTGDKVLVKPSQTESRGSSSNSSSSNTMHEEGSAGPGGEAGTRYQVVCEKDKNDPGAIKCFVDRSSAQGESLGRACLEEVLKQLSSATEAAGHDTLRSAMARTLRVKGGLKGDTSLPSSGFFWECLPFTQETMRHEPFSMKLIATRAFDAMDADTRAFAEHIDRAPKDQDTLHFSNLGGDAELIVPLQLAGVPADRYAHAGAFFVNTTTKETQDAEGERDEDEDNGEEGEHGEERRKRHNKEGKQGTEPLLQQQLNVLRIAADQALQRVHEQPIVCLSTSGLGVSYLHVRVDRRPKYYQSEEYRSYYRRLQQTQ